MLIGLGCGAAALGVASGTATAPGVEDDATADRACGMGIVGRD
jgi:hypothetical protein